MDNDVSLDNDTSLSKSDLFKLLTRTTLLTRQALVCKPKVAQEYYEKVQHLISVTRLVKNFERQLLFDLDVD
jgi:hypothetical protein